MGGEKNNDAGELEELSNISGDSLAVTKLKTADHPLLIDGEDGFAAALRSIPAVGKAKEISVYPISHVTYTYTTSAERNEAKRVLQAGIDALGSLSILKIGVSDFDKSYTLRVEGLASSTLSKDQQQTMFNAALVENERLKIKPTPPSPPATEPSKPTPRAAERANADASPKATPTPPAEAPPVVVVPHRKVSAKPEAASVVSEVVKNFTNANSPISNMGSGGFAEVLKSIPAVGKATDVNAWPRSTTYTYANDRERDLARVVLQVGIDKIGRDVGITVSVPADQSHTLEVSGFVGWLGGTLSYQQQREMYNAALAKSEELDRAAAQAKNTALVKDILKAEAILDATPAVPTSLLFNGDKQSDALAKRDMALSNFNEVFKDTQLKAVKGREGGLTTLVIEGHGAIPEALLGKLQQNMGDKAIAVPAQTPAPKEAPPPRPALVTAGERANAVPAQTPALIPTTPLQSAPTTAAALPKPTGRAVARQAEEGERQRPSTPTAGGPIATVPAQTPALIPTTPLQSAPTTAAALPKPTGRAGARQAEEGERQRPSTQTDRRKGRDYAHDVGQPAAKQHRKSERSRAGLKCKHSAPEQQPTDWVKGFHERTMHGGVEAPHHHSGRRDHSMRSTRLEGDPADRREARARERKEAGRERTLHEKLPGFGTVPAN